MLDGCVTVSWLAASQPVTLLLCEIAQLIWSEKQPGGGNLLKPFGLASVPGRLGHHSERDRQFPERVSWENYPTDNNPWGNKHRGVAAAGEPD